MSIANIVNDAATQAQAAAAAAPAQMPAVAPQQGGALIEHGVAPTPLTMDNVGGQRLMVEAWLKSTEFGQMLSVDGEDTGMIAEIEAEIFMEANEGFFVCETLRYGNPVQYDSTFDRVNSESGQPWAQILAHAAAVTPGARPYASVKVCATVASDVKDASGKVVLEEGTDFGITTSQTGFQLWSSFYKKVQKAGLLGEMVKVKITNKSKKNAKGKWGMAQFELITE